MGKPDRTLGDEQYCKIAEKLDGTHGNACRLALKMFNVEWDDQDYQELRKVTGLFSCAECGIWTGEDGLAEGYSETCSDCADNMEPNHD